MRKHGSIIIFVVPLLTAPVLAADPPSAKELLEKYGANLDKQTSFIVKWESSGVGSHNLSKERINAEGEMSFSAGEVCYDGFRKAERFELWGKVDQGPTRSSREQAYYSSLLWDGEARYRYRRGPSDPGSLTLLRPRGYDQLAKWRKSGGKLTDLAPELRLGAQICLLSGSGAALHFGYFTDDIERLDSVLLDQSKSLSVRPKMAKVNGANCHVIDADTRRGKCTVWIDPKHGYQTARVVVARRGGDEALKLSGYKLPSNGTIDVTVDYMGFKNIEGAWVALASRLRYDRVYGVPAGAYYRCHGSRRITSIELNPDHETLRSFVPRDIRNGAQVYDSAWWGKEGADRLVWLNGKAVVGPGRGPRKEAAKAVATRPSARAAHTETRPAMLETIPGEMTGDGQAVYEEGLLLPP